MRASCRWLRELSGVHEPPAALAERLTRAGLEVEGLSSFGLGLDGVVIGEVRSRAPHPRRDRLTEVVVFDGKSETTVLCGADNVPAPGGRVLLATLGSVLPQGMRIEERTIAGVVSRGMLCSEEELAIGSEGDGIAVVEAMGLSTRPEPGTPVAEALALDDTVLTLSITPNRPDALGHLGLARELAAAAGVAFSPPSPPVPARRRRDKGSVAGAGLRDFEALLGAHETVSATSAPSLVPPLRVTLVDRERCPRYGAGIVRGVSVAPSPFWLRYRLMLLGLRSLNNVVDATNYAMLERGHPVHAFDLGKIVGHHIVVRCATVGEQLTTLDGVVRTLAADDLLISDDKGPVAIAGVMGAARSEVDVTTRDILVEAAYFDPPSVRRTSKRLLLHTDASHRFERGVDATGVWAQLSRTVQLIADLSGGTAQLEALDVVGTPLSRPTIRYRLVRGDDLLGIHVAPDRVTEMLSSLGCEVVPIGSETLSVTPPGHRPDLQGEVDLVEEVGRLVGYDAIAGRIPRVRPSVAGASMRLVLRRRVREILAGAGCDEAISYSFVSEADLSLCRAPAATVLLQNPLSEDRSVLRTSLVPGLLAATRRAQQHQVNAVRLFEIGRTFHARGSGETLSAAALGSLGSDDAACVAPWCVVGEDDALPREPESLAFVLAGPKTEWIGEGEPWDFYDGKGLCEHLFDQLAGRPVTVDHDVSLDALAPYLHPKRRARLRFSDVTVGVLGELHPDVAQAVGLSGRPVIGVVGLEAVVAALAALTPRQAKEPPRFPAVSRDVALLFPEGREAGPVARAATELGGSLVEDVKLFDFYRGPGIPEGQKSLAFRIVYRDPAGTLTDKAVDAVHGRVVQGLEARFGAKVR